jgi:hypothetical protein
MVLGIGGAAAISSFVSVRALRQRVRHSERPATPLRLEGWRPATVVAGYVATARLHDNRQYLSDVIFGAAMGIAAQRTVTLHAGRCGATLVPAVGRRNAGMMVVVGSRTE